MVRRRGHSAYTIVSGREATSNGGRKEAIVVAGIIDALEEGELGWIRRLGGIEGVAQVLNRDVGVADDLAAAVKVLWRRVVGELGVGECAGGEALGLHRDGEVFVCSYGLAELG